MCIIVYKPKYKNTPAKDTLLTCFEHNSDGAGYMFNYKNKVYVRKGFTTFKEFYNAYISDYINYNLKIRDVVLHFRIGTSGGFTENRTHPFNLFSPLSNKLEYKTKIGVVHNGVFADYSYSNEFSDTQLYINNFLSPVVKKFNYKLDNKLLNTIIDKSIGFSKLIILTKDKCYMYGNFIENNGIFYSNNTYTKYTYTYSKYPYYE